MPCTLQIWSQLNENKLSREIKYRADCVQMQYTKICQIFPSNCTDLHIAHHLYSEKDVSHLNKPCINSNPTSFIYQ